MTKTNSTEGKETLQEKQQLICCCTLQIFLVVVNKYNAFYYTTVDIIYT